MLDKLKQMLINGDFENSDDLLIALEQMSDDQKELLKVAYDLGHDAGFEEAEE